MTGKFKLDDKNTTIALKMLARVTDIFTASGIRYSLTAGTLLGIVRENRLLPWDKDMDLRVFRDDIEKLKAVLWKIRFAGYMVRVRRQNRDDAPLVKNEIRIIKVYSRKYLFFKGAVVMDCFVATHDNDSYVWSCGGERRYTKKAVPAKFYGNLKLLEFAGHKYYAPEDAEGYLTYKYGDWRVPKTKWNYAKDDLTIIAQDHKPKKKKK